MVVVRGANFTGNETVYFGGYQVKAEKDYLVYATQAISGGGVTTAPFGGYIFNVPALCPDTNTTCIPVSIANPNIYQVQVVNVNGKSNTVPFTVTTTTTIPVSSFSITALSPNGGSYTDSSPLSISWSPYSNSSAFDYYQVMLGNKVSGVETNLKALVSNDFIDKNTTSFVVQNLSGAVKNMLTNSNGKTAEQMKDGYYISVSAMTSGYYGKEVSRAVGNAFSIVPTQLSVIVNFTKNLQFGDVDTDVKILQQALNRSADTQVATTGAGSPGMETTTFDLATKLAVIKFQNKYAAEILALRGLTTGAGFF